MAKGTLQIKDILNPCGHRNSERVEALKEIPSAVCPACLLERIEGLEEIIGLAIGGIDAFVGFWSDAQVKKDMLAIKETLEQALVKPRI